MNHTVRTGRRGFWVGSMCLVAVLMAGLIGGPTRLRADDKEDGGSLETDMEAMSGSLKGLVSSLSDPANDAESLRLIAQAQQHALDAKLKTPPMIEGMTGSKKDKTLSAYRADTAKLVKTLIDVELDILGGHHDKALEKVNTKIVDIREKAHKKYRPAER